MRNAECGPSFAQKLRQGEVRNAERPETGGGPILVTRRGLAVALGVSVRTVERMLHDEEIEAVRLRGSVRFYVPDVVRRLVESGATRKNGRKADLTAESAKSAENFTFQISDFKGGRGAARLKAKG